MGTGTAIHVNDSYLKKERGHNEIFTSKTGQNFYNQT